MAVHKQREKNRTAIQAPLVPTRTRVPSRITPSKSDRLSIIALSFVLVLAVRDDAPKFVWAAAADELDSSAAEPEAARADDGGKDIGSRRRTLGRARRGRDWGRTQAVTAAGEIQRKRTFFFSLSLFFSL